MQISINGSKREAIYAFILALIVTIAISLRLDIYSLEDLLTTSEVKDTDGWFRFLWDLKLSFDDCSILSVLAVAGLTILFFFVITSQFDLRCKISALCLSAVFAFLEVFGESFKRYSGFDGVFYSMRNFFKAGILGFGYWLLFFCSILLLLKVLSNIRIENGTDLKVKWFSTNIQSFVFVWLVIVVCWLPYAVAYYPGLTNYDFFDMLDTFYGNDTNSIRVVIPISDEVTLNNNNPVLQTLIAVFVMKLGALLGSPYYGIFIFCISQMLCYSAIISYSILVMAKSGINHYYRVFTLLFFAIIPWHSNFALTTLKDTNYSFITLLFLMLLCKMIMSEKNFFSDKKTIVAFGFITLLLMLLRNNGVYIIFISSVFIIIYYRKYWKQMLICFIAPLLLYVVVITHIIYPALLISPGSKAEMYSLPLQQIARVVKENNNDLPEEDEIVISKVIRDYDEIADLYDPEFADPIKSRFNKYATKDDMKAFFKVWLKYLKKQPVTYVEAGICDCYGYFYPEAEHWLIYVDIAPTGLNYGVSSPEDRSKMRQELNQLSYIFRSIPGLGLLMSVGFYSWIMMFIITYLIYTRRKKRILMWLPNIVLLATVMAGPVNTMPRYVYPLIISAPFLVAMSLKKEDDGNESVSNYSCL